MTSSMSDGGQRDDDAGAGLLLEVPDLLLAVDGRAEAQRAGEHLAVIVAVPDQPISLLEDRQLGETDVALGDLDADLRAGLTQAAEVAVAGLHVGDDRAPLAEVDAVGLGLLEARG